MMGMAEAGEKAGLLLRSDAADDEFRRALESATNSILNAEAFRQALSADSVSRLLPERLLRPPVAALPRRRPLCRTEWRRNAAGIRALRRAQRSGVGGKPRAMEHRAAGAGVDRSRVRLEGKAGRGVPHSLQEKRRRMAGSHASAARSSTPTSTAMRSSLIPTPAGRS